MSNFGDFFLKILLIRWNLSEQIDKCNFLYSRVICWMRIVKSVAVNHKSNYQIFKRIQCNELV